MNKTTKTILFIVHSAVIAALYVVLTMIAAGFDLASGAIQVRFSECLTVLPFFTAAGIPGVTIGCFLANIITGGALPDIIFGTLATFIGSLGTYYLRKHRFLCTIPPVVANAIIIPFILKYAYALDGALWFFALTVGAGEIISCVLFGQVLMTALMPVRHRIFGNDSEAVRKADKILF